MSGFFVGPYWTSVVHLFGVVVDQFTLEQIQRRLVVQNDVVKRVGQDFGHPHQASLNIVDEEQVAGTKQQSRSTQVKPSVAHSMHEIAQ